VTPGREGHSPIRSHKCEMESAAEIVSVVLVVVGVVGMFLTLERIQGDMDRAHVLLQRSERNDTEIGLWWAECGWAWNAMGWWFTMTVMGWFVPELARQAYLDARV